MSTRSLLALILLAGTLAIVAAGCGEESQPPLPPLQADAITQPDLALDLPALVSTPNFEAKKSVPELEAVVGSVHTDANLQPLRDALAQAGIPDAQLDGLVRPATYYLSMQEGDLHKKMFDEGHATVALAQEQTIAKIKAEAAARGVPIDWNEIDRTTHLLSLTGERKEVK